MENTIQYELTPKKVKNIIIRVKANGVVAVTMPYRMSKKKVDAFVQSKAEWIRMMQKKLANQQRIGCGCTGVEPAERAVFKRIYCCRSMNCFGLIIFLCQRSDSAA